MRTLRARIRLDAGRGADERVLADAAEGVALDAAYGVSETMWRAQWEHARALAAARPVRDPLAAFDAAIASLDSLRAGSLGYRLDNLYLRDRRPMVDQAIAAAQARGDAERCLRYADAVKSRWSARRLCGHAARDAERATPQAARLDRSNTKTF